MCLYNNDKERRAQTETLYARPQNNSGSVWNKVQIRPGSAVYSLVGALPEVPCHVEVFEVEEKGSEVTEREEKC